MTNNSFLLQERIDLTKQFGFYIRIVAGIDIVTGYAEFHITALDPATGEFFFDTFSVCS